MVGVELRHSVIFVGDGVTSVALGSGEGRPPVDGSAVGSAPLEGVGDGVAYSQRSVGLPVEVTSDTALGDGVEVVTVTVVVVGLVTIVVTLDGELSCELAVGDGDAYSNR